MKLSNLMMYYGMVLLLFVALPNIDLSSAPSLTETVLLAQNEKKAAKGKKADGAKKARTKKGKKVNDKKAKGKKTTAKAKKRKKKNKKNKPETGLEKAKYKFKQKVKRANKTFERAGIRITKLETKLAEAETAFSKMKSSGKVDASKSATYEANIASSKKMIEELKTTFNVENEKMHGIRTQWKAMKL